VLRGKRRAELLDRVEVKGLEHLAAAEEKSSTGGLLIVMAHYGNWELACAKVVELGIPTSVVYRESENPLLDPMSVGVRLPGPGFVSENSDLEQIPMGRAGIRFVRALKAGRKVVVLLDQDADREEGVFVTFFGRPASTRSGPLALASRLGIPVLPTFIRRPRVKDITERVRRSPTEPNRESLETILREVTLEKQASMAMEFDAVHNVERARDVGSLSEIFEPAELRPRLIASLEEARRGSSS